MKYYFTLWNPKTDTMSVDFIGPNVFQSKIRLPITDFTLAKVIFTIHHLRKK